MIPLYDTYGVFLSSFMTALRSNLLVTTPLRHVEHKDNHKATRGSTLHLQLKGQWQVDSLIPVSCILLLLARSINSIFTLDVNF